MRGNPNLRHVLWVLLLCACMASPERAVADDGPSVTVPDVRRRRIEDAMRIIEAAGLKVGDVYEFSRERILKMFRVRGVLGTVFLQKPTPGTGWPASKPIDLVVVSEKDGKLPSDLLGAKRKADTPAKETPQDTGAVPPNGSVRDDPLPPVPPPADGLPATPRPGEGPPKDVPRKDAPVEAAGSPDAPRKAAKADPGRVPEMVGLDLAEAEMLIRDAKMTLHVERVPGHPVGKVLKQMPAGGSKRPPAGAVKVVITAGGDFESPMPAAPAVYVGEITVPGLLDRTKLQAERIVVALGLDVDFREAKRGLAGRVVDQKPAAGQKVAKGGIVMLWIGPGGEDAADCDVPPPLGPIQPRKDGAPGKAEPKKAEPKKADAKKVPETPKAPLEPGPLQGGVPQLVSPGVNTPIPAGEKVPVGFTWRGVTGASAYILEIEEMGAEGRWMPLARKPARTTAVLMDVERLDPRGTSRLRWRVTAVIGGRHGTASKWVTLK